MRRVDPEGPAGTQRPEWCGIVLAAGDGSRLRPFVRRLHGEEIPKQYARLLGERTMLEQTLRRAERLIPAERVFVVVGEAHLQYPAARQALSGRPPGTVVLQPANRDTGPGLLLPLAHLRKRHPDAVVAVFPSDHCVAEEPRFMAHVERALRAVEEAGSRMVLLGVEPLEPEPEYGYIVPTDEDAGGGLRRVSRFVEKPPIEAARELAASGGLWNTLVMAFRPSTFLELARPVAPDVCRFFDSIHEAIGTRAEREVIREAYGRLASLNLSRDLLEVFPLRDPDCLQVLPVRGVQWSDLGSEQRILRALGQPALAGGPPRLGAAPLAGLPQESFDAGPPP